MYTTAVCPYCVRAKQLLQAKGVAHIEEVRVDLNPDERVKMMEITGRHVPIICDEQRIRPANSEVNRLIADNSKLRSLTDWKPSVGWVSPSWSSATTGVCSSTKRVSSRRSASS
ncbi:hypothetical protein EBX93_15155 [bacterium]|nr:hypothetical protein [bacterium]